MTKTKEGGLWSKMSKYKYAYLLILPAILFVLLFSYVPMAGIVIAFKDFDILKGITGSPWVGMKHFKEIFTYPDMLLAIKNTVVYGVAIVFGTFPFPVILALLFNEIKNMKFKKVVQTITYMPYFLSWISVIGLAYAFLATEGPINQLMARIYGDGYVAKNILMDSKYFLPVIFVSHIWKNVGWSSVIFMASIAGIDPTLYEAADIDGCGKLKQVWHITIPSISGTILVVLVMSLGSIVNVNFEQVYGFQNVFTQEQTEVINTLIYRQGIQNGKYSLATAFGLAQGLVSIMLISVANFISKKMFDMSIW